MSATSGQTLIIRAALFVVLAEFFFASMGVAIRQVSESASNEQVVFFRNLFGVLMLLPWLMRRQYPGLRTKVPHLHLLRSLAGLGAMYCFYYAIAHLPLAEAMLLKLSSPLFIPIIAAIWLGEAVSNRVRIALATGFLGVLLVLNPTLSGINSVALIALGGGALAALAKTTVRRLGSTEPPTRTVFYFALVGSLVSAVPLLWAWQPLSSFDYGWLLTVALLATAGQLFLTQGFGLAPAARIGTFGYSSVLFGALYGWWLWDEVPTWLSVLGAVLVVVAGIVAGRRDSRDTLLTPATRPES